MKTIVPHLAVFILTLLCGCGKIDGSTSTPVPLLLDAIAQSAVLTSDSFNRTTFGSGTDAALGGTSYTWNTGSGAPSVNANTLNSIANGAFIITVNSTFHDCKASLKIATMPVANGAEIGIIFRYADINNFWSLRASTSGTSLYSKVSGSETLQYNTKSVLTNGDKIEVQFKGNTIYVLLQGVLAASISSSLLASNTSHGIYMPSAVAAADDFVVYGCI